MLRFHRQTTPYQHGSWSASQSQNRLWSAFNKYWDIWPSCTHLQSWRTLWMLLTQRLPWELRWPKSKDGLGLWDVLLSGMSHFFNFENSLSHCLLLVSIFGAIRYNRQTRELTPKSSCLQWMLSWYANEPVQSNVLPSTLQPGVACLHAKPSVFYFFTVCFSLIIPHIYLYRWFVEDSMRRSNCGNLRLLERQFTECLVRSFILNLITA